MAALKSLYQVESLNLRLNQIPDLKQVEMIRGLPNLIELNLSDNPLSLPANVNKDNLNGLLAYFKAHKN